MTRTSPGAAKMAAWHPDDGITVGFTGTTGAARGVVTAGLGRVVVLVVVVVLMVVDELAVEALLALVHEVSARAPRVVARRGCGRKRRILARAPTQEPPPPGRRARWSERPVEWGYDEHHDATG